MYSACLYCSASLARNAVVEAFPIGRRLAFDAAKGRLWVVCGSCARWCLAPIEERWEAIEACERQFRDARLRASTSEIGLVRLREGLELVRIGAPLRPEMAAWRYGRQYSARRRRAIAVGTGAAGAGALAATAAVTTGAASAWVGLLAMGVVPVIHVTGLLGFAAYAALDSFSATDLVVDGRRVKVYRADLRETHLVTSEMGDGWALRLKHAYGRLTVTGADAMRITARLLTRANGNGASGWMVESATRRLSEASDPAALVRTLAAHAEQLAAGHQQRKREFLHAMEHSQLAGKFDETRNPASLALIETPVRLALEMALHEESERAALEGELAPLVAAWREAEEIAGIADGLLVPVGVQQRLDTLKQDAGRHDAAAADPRGTDRR